ncbi:MAG: hypothetical protein BWY91_03117 [bacterium ADurb.BinA028]|nr:MAG: hypothetical protein BWY91_03117 [bacterium ADurb.BinA028]
MTVVPVSSVSSCLANGATGTPWSKLIRKALPFWRTSTSRRLDRALTTDEPTPCRPPDTLYPPPPNLPPACNWVSTSSTALTPSVGWMSVGMPRPLSRTRTPPSARSVTSIVSAYPASASSTALSTISHTRWCRPRSPVDPMYMPGRLRTASSPSRTVIAEASYAVSPVSVTSAGIGVVGSTTVLLSVGRRPPGRAGRSSARSHADGCRVCRTSGSRRRPV